MYCIDPEIVINAQPHQTCVKTPRKWDRYDEALGVEA